MMRDRKYRVGSDEMGNSLLVEHETRIVFMSELELIPLKYPYRGMLNSLRVVEGFITIRFVLEQNETEYLKRIMIKDS